MDSEQRKDAATALSEALRDTRPGMRETVLAKLKAIYVRREGGDETTDPDVARAALPGAIRALRDPDPEVRIAGIQAIELLAPDAERWIPELARALSDSVAAVRIAALEALCEFGPRASEVAPLVAERQRDAPTPEERSAAADALHNFGAGRGA